MLALPPRDRRSLCRSTIAAVVLLAAAFTALTACSSSISGQGSLAGSGPLSSGPTTPAASSDSSTSTAPPAPIRDFTTVRYAVPAGFVRSYSYSEAVELEQHYQASYFVPKAAYNSQDVLTVIVYTLPDDVTVDAAQQQQERVDYYNKKLHAQLPNGTKESPIAGLPGFEENVVQPPSYHYATWFAFGRHHLLQFSCQIGTARSAADIIANGCQSMLSSLRVS